MNKQQTNKVVPFTGEFYPVVEPPAAPSASPTGAYLIMTIAALVAGLSLGAIAVYQSTDQVRMRQLQSDSQHLQQVKNQVCKE